MVDHPAVATVDQARLTQYPIPPEGFNGSIRCPGAKCTSICSQIAPGRSDVAGHQFWRGYVQFNRLYEADWIDCQIDIISLRKRVPWITQIEINPMLLLIGVG